MSRVRAATILDPIRAHAERDPGRTLFGFLDSDGGVADSYDYEGFLGRTRDIAAHIQREARLGAGERVLLCYPPGIEMVCAFFACVRIGLIPVPVYPPSRRGFGEALRKMGYIASDCGAAAVLTEGSNYWSFKLHRVRRKVTGRSSAQDSTARMKWIVTTDAEPSTGARIREAHSDILFLQYTSGSTSDPKGVMVTHENVVSNCHSVFDHVPVGVSWLPQYHDMGLIGAYLFVAIKGGTTFGLSPIDFLRRPLLWLQAIDRYRATASTAPNFAYGYCLRPDKVSDECLDGLDLSSLRMLLNGAEPVRADVFRGFLRRFGPYGLNPDSFRAAYGLAEYTLAVAAGNSIRGFDAGGMAVNEVRRSEDDEETVESVSLVGCGLPLGSTRIKIVEAQGRLHEVPADRIGEIWVTGPGRCRGYWGRPALSEQTFEARTEGAVNGGPGWLRTGDLGFIHDGELFVCGRAKDLIIKRGRNYHPQDIEAVVEEDPAIRSGCVAAFGVDEDGSERLVVVAELRTPGRRPEGQDLNRRIQQRVGIGADRFVYVRRRSISKTSSGKIVRHEARRRWLEGGLDIVAETEWLSPAGDESPGDLADPGGGCAPGTRELLETLSQHGITGQETLSLAETGLDSLALAEFAADLEGCLEAAGAGDLAASIDLRWVQRIAVCELFELLEQLEAAAPFAKLRFRRALAALRSDYQDVEREMMRVDAQGYVPAVAADRPRPPERGSRGILLTGGTGFFGPFLLQSLLEQHEGPIYVLVRARDRAHGLERLRSGLSSLHPQLTLPGSPECCVLEDRIVPVCGDLARPNLGVSEAQWRLLSERVHSVFHNGALVNYLLDYASMRASNVGATREVVRFAGSGCEKTLNYVSTTFVFGWSNKDTLFESDRNRDMSVLDFGYSQSKWVSEQIVLDAMARGLPGRVFRPALITPSIEGAGESYDIAMRLLVFMLKHGMTTTAQNQVSFSPADIVANNIAAIAGVPETVGRTFHVTRDSYARMQDITDILGRLTGTSFASHDIDAFVPLVIEKCGKDDLLFPLLNFLVRSVDNITAMEFKRYDNRNYREARALAPGAMEDPALEDVVRGIVRFMRRHRLIEGGRGAETVLEGA